MKREEIVRELRQETEMMLAAADARIAWVLQHPHMSDWLKEALRTADGLDPIALQSDVEMLKHLVVTRCHAQIKAAMGSAHVD
jgi:hypothetical protein